MEQPNPIIQELHAEKAKRREQTIKMLTFGDAEDPQIIEALQVLVSTDPVQYVRKAARAALLAAGHKPALSNAPILLEDEKNTRVAVYVVITLIVAACLILFVVAEFTPQIKSWAGEGVEQVR